MTTEERLSELEVRLVRIEDTLRGPPTPPAPPQSLLQHAWSSLRGTTRSAVAVAVPVFRATYKYALTAVLASVLTAGLSQQQGCQLPWVSPNPNPVVPPTPTPVVTTIPAKDFRVLMVFEERDLGTYPRPQLNVLYSQPVASAIGRGQWRAYDKDANLSKDEPIWAAAMARPREKTPWMVVFDAQSKAVAFEGPLATDESTMLKVVTKYKGN